MSLISRMRRQDAVYWPVTGNDGYGGVLVGAPVAIKCRWEDKNEEFKNARGVICMSRSVVYVDRPMKEGELLQIGTLDEIMSLGKENGIPIQAFSTLPNLNNTENLYTAWL